MKPTVPSSTQPIVGAGGLMTTVFQRFLNALVGPVQAIESVPVSGSPLSLTAPQAGVLAISGGTVSAVTLVRAKVTLSFGGVAFVPVAPGDVVTITYSAAPTVNFIPS